LSDHLKQVQSSFYFNSEVDKSSCN